MSENDMAIRFYGAKLPRKLKKEIYGTRRSRRRFDLAFIRVLTRKPKLHVNVTFYKEDLVVRNAGVLDS